MPLPAGTTLQRLHDHLVHHVGDLPFPLHVGVLVDEDRARCCGRAGSSTPWLRRSSATPGCSRCAEDHGSAVPRRRRRRTPCATAVMPRCCADCGRSLEVLSGLMPGDSCLPCGGGLDAAGAPDDCPSGSRDERVAHPVQVQDVPGGVVVGVTGPAAAFVLAYEHGLGLRSARRSCLRPAPRGLRRRAPTCGWGRWP